jgi:uncharacterized RDD family membrane protein YckC
MSDAPTSQPAGWYHAEGDPPASVRYWDGSRWIGLPQSASGVMATASDLASPWLRIGARLIDLVIYIVVGIVALVASLPFLISDDFNVNDPGFQVLSLVVGLVLSVVDVAMIALWGGSIGKLIVGIRVTDAAGVTPVGWGRSTRRHLTDLVTFVPVAGQFISAIIGFVSLVLLFTDAERRTVWDRVADTRVRKV